MLARVNGKTYSLFGNPEDVGNTLAATTESVSFTSSHTFVNLTAGAASVTLDFFSPVLPRKEDYVRQSLPYSYLTVTAGESKPKVFRSGFVLIVKSTFWGRGNRCANIQCDRPYVDCPEWCCQPQSFIFRLCGVLPILPTIANPVY